MSFGYLCNVDMMQSVEEGTSLCHLTRERRLTLLTRQILTGGRSETTDFFLVVIALCRAYLSKSISTFQGVSRKTNQRGLVPASYLIKKNQVNPVSSLPGLEMGVAAVKCLHCCVFYRAFPWRARFLLTTLPLLFLGWLIVHGEIVDVDFWLWSFMYV